MRVHSKCLTGDVFHSARCDCGPQLDTAMERIADEGRGVLLYLNQEGRGIGLANKIRATSCRIRGSTPSKPTSASASRPTSATTASARRSSATSASDDAAADQQPAQVRRPAGLRPVRVRGVPLEIPASDSTQRYLKTKKDKLGHKLRRLGVERSSL